MRNEESSDTKVRRRAVIGALGLTSLSGCLGVRGGGSDALPEMEVERKDKHELNHITQIEAKATEPFLPFAKPGVHLEVWATQETVDYILLLQDGEQASHDALATGEEKVRFTDMFNYTELTETVTLTVAAVSGGELEEGTYRDTLVGGEVLETTQIEVQKA